MKVNIVAITIMLFVWLPVVPGKVQEGSPDTFFYSDTLRRATILADTTIVDTLHQDTLLHDTLPEPVHPLVWDNVMHNELVAFLLQSHRKAMQDMRGIPGFRVHLYMDSGNRARLNTQREQADFEELYPDQRSYIVYEEPYFKLRAGDFRTRLDARRFLEHIRKDYPAAYIVVDKINFPELD